MIDFAAARRIMVDCQVRPSDVTDLNVIEAMLAVPREAFLPQTQRAIAYLDVDILVGFPNNQNRHLMAPAALARLLQAAEIAPSDRALVVGCAFGYAAALVSRLAGHVTAIDTDAERIAAAGMTLATLGYRTISTAATQHAQGDAVTTPYDVIVLAGATEIEPLHLYSQLAPQGRLVGVFATRRPLRAMLVTRSHNGFGNRALFDATASVIPGFEKPPAFVF